MLEILNNIDTALFFSLNGLHSSFFDLVFFYGTKSVIWIPLYLYLFYLVIRRYKWQTLWVLLFAVLMLLFSDQISNLVKGWFERPRPTYESGLAGIHTVYGYTGGQFGFYSAHASNTMSVAVYLIILLRRQSRWFPWLILLWAVFIAYTRIYLGVHYPGDILAGMLAGSILGWMMSFFCEKTMNRFSIRS